MQRSSWWYIPLDKRLLITAYLVLLYVGGTLNEIITDVGFKNEINVACVY